MPSGLLWVRRCWIAIACLALASCTRFGYGRAIETADAEPGADDLRFHQDSGGLPWDAAPEAQMPDLEPAPDAPPPPTGPVGAWLLDEGSGQVVSGAPGNAGYRGKSNVADSADPTWEPTSARVCKGAALTFDGGDDMVTIPGTSPAGLSKFTITFSIYVTGNGGGGLPRILTKENGNASDTLVHYRSGDKAIAVNMFNTSNTLFATFASGVVTGQRSNWALTYDDTGDRRLHAYKNGKETTYTRQDVLTGTLRTTTNPWRIGNEVNGIRGFDGTIDEVRVYDRVLTAAEISALSALCPS